ncbi:MAG: DUF4340 domain-containing protein [Coprococcus sp.]
MKKYKSLIILLAVLVVLVVAYVVTGQLKKKSAEKENEEKQIAVLDMSDITSIQYTNGTDTMSFIKEGGTWYSESDKEFPLQQSSLKTMAETFGTLSANRELTDGDTLADYGLEEPQYTITLKDADGEQQNIYIGNAAGEDYYMTVGDKEKIYTVDYSVVNAMNFDLDSMLQKDTFPSIGADNIKKVTITKVGETTEYDADNSDQSDDITAIGGGLGAAYFVDCVDYSVQADELAQYGLDEAQRTTVTVVYTDSDDKEQTFILYVGGRDESDAYNYVQMDGSKMVNTMTKETVNSILNIEE